MMKSTIFWIWSCVSSQPSEPVPGKYCFSILGRSSAAAFCAQRRFARSHVITVSKCSVAIGQICVSRSIPWLAANGLPSVHFLNKSQIKRFLILDLTQKGYAFSTHWRRTWLSHVLKMKSSVRSKVFPPGRELPRKLRTLFERYGTRAEAIATFMNGGTDFMLKTLPDYYAVRSLHHST